MNPLSASDQRIAAAAKARPPTLEPPFPYRTLPFDPAAFGVLADPPKPPVDSPAPAQT